MSRTKFISIKEKHSNIHNFTYRKKFKKERKAPSASHRDRPPPQQQFAGQFPELLSAGAARHDGRRGRGAGDDTPSCVPQRPSLQMVGGGGDLPAGPRIASLCDGGALAGLIRLHAAPEWPSLQMVGGGGDLPAGPRVKTHETHELSRTK